MNRETGLWIAALAVVAFLTVLSGGWSVPAAEELAYLQDGLAASGGPFPWP